MKLSGSPDVVKMLDTVGVGHYRVLSGIAEIAFATLFAFPKTMKIGFILLTDISQAQWPPRFHTT
ncbi:hypothetical protein [Dyadobacter sp. CY343]|uniref:hypothetical protein n=1 Tax=Dyadobacter sp. CY343 TaxID=2907299 RepID=UPI001F2439E2|nr:hypothetical protein [Dyadobacter sp. CY343]MCE7063385.1 hypothetical protein [Dyadobacter sp. CY343]